MNPCSNDSSKADVEESPTDTATTIIANLSQILTWIDDAPDPSKFETNDDFMKLSVEIMNRCLYLMRLGASLAPDAEPRTRGYKKERAIIVGHMVRITKLYEGMTLHVCQRQGELAVLFFRMILECSVRIEYILSLRDKKTYLRNFVLASYKPERELLQDLQKKETERPLIPIERRMLKSINTWMNRDQITQEELLNNNRWSLDGVDFRTLMARMEYNKYAYAYSFGISSHHFIHGDWYDICKHHLKRDGEFYLPRLEFSEPDPRVPCALTTVCLRTLLIFLEWSETDPAETVATVVEQLRELNRAVDEAHERLLGG